MARLTRKFGPSDRGNPSDLEHQFLWVFSHDLLLYVSLMTSLLNLLGVSMSGIVCINAFVFFRQFRGATDNHVRRAGG